MQRKDLALRVLSTAAIMSIVTSIAAPAFADIYYIGNGSIDVETITSTDGKQYVKVTQGDKTYTDTSDEIVIKDGTSEKNATQIEESRIDGKKAKVAIPDKERPATQELEAAGLEDAAGESQPDPDDAFTLSEAEEDSAQTQEGEDTTKKEEDPPKEPSTENPTENPKKDVVYEYAPADPNPEQQATKLAPTSATPAAKTQEATQADPPTTLASPVGSADNPTTNVIKVVNNWVGKAAKELKIRLSNVNIKAEDAGRKAAMDVSGGGKTKVELDGQNVLDSYSVRYQAGLRKQGEGTLTITDETDDRGNKITATKSGTSGSLTAKGAGGNGAAGIGGSVAEGTKNITIEGYATVHAAGGDWGAGIGGGGYYGEEKPGDAENIIIQGYATVDAKGGGGGAGIGGGYAGNAKNIIIRGHSKVTATARDGAAIGGGSAGWSSYYGGSAKGIVICDHATVAARSDMGHGAAIGAAGDNGKDTEAEVTIGTAGATAEQEDVHVTATGFCGSAIGNGAKDTKVTIQGHSTIRMESERGNSTAIGSKDGNVEVNIKDNVTIDAKDEGTSIRYEGGGSGIGGEDIRVDSNRKVVVNIDGGTNGKVKIGDGVQIFGKYGAISATEVNIGNNVLLKMKPWKSPDDKCINVNGAEAAVGTRNNPAAGGLVNTIGDNTELWYYSKGWQQKIVHGKNVCTKKEIGRKDATCTEDGWVKYGCTYESNRHATAPEHIDEWTETIPATGHRWGEWVEDTAAGTRTRECSVCHATETEPLPSDTNSALELRVVDAEGMDQPFTVSQNGTLRTYTGAYDTATLTGDLNTLRYLQDHGAQTIRFVTTGQTSSFAINDLLAQGSGSEVFYLTHREAEEPTLLLVEADHSDLVKD